MTQITFPRAASLLTLLLAAGCSSAGFASGDSVLGDQRQIYGDIENLQFAKSVQVQLPARGVTAVDVEDPRWSQFLTDAFEKDAGTWSTLEPLQLFAEDRNGVRNSLEPLRAAASRQRADLLVIGSLSTRDHRSTNALGIFKLLIVPMLFLPTDEHRLAFSTRISIIDVRNGLLYTTVEDHRESEFTTSTVGGSSRVRSEAFTMAEASVTAVRDRVERKLLALARGE